MSKRISEPRRQAILDELRRGDTYLRIARRHDTTKQAVALIAAKHGLNRRRRLEPCDDAVASANDGTEIPDPTLPDELM